MNRTNRTQAIRWKFMGLIFGAAGLAEAVTAKTLDFTSAVVLGSSVLCTLLCFYIARKQTAADPKHGANAL
jgi:hypothetical protein